MRIAIDAMGGDHAPVEILQGALSALELLDPSDELILVGNPDVIKSTLGDALTQHQNIRIEPAMQVISMDDSPVDAVRHKRDQFDYCAWSSWPLAKGPMPSSPPAIPA